MILCHGVVVVRGKTPGVPSFSVCLALLRGDQSRMLLNSARSRLPRAPVSTSLRRRVLLNGVRPTCLTCVAVYRLLLNTAGHPCLALAMH